MSVLPSAVFEADSLAVATVYSRLTHEHQFAEGPDYYGYKNVSSGSAFTWVSGIGTHPARAFTHGAISPTCLF